MENLFRLTDHENFLSHRCIWVGGLVIKSASPSDLATSACLREQGILYSLLSKETIA